MDSKAKGLLGNLGVFTLASFATKLLNYLLLPLYTSILTTSDYGTIDLVNTIVSLLLPILTLCCSDAVLRFGISEKGGEAEALHIGLWHVAMGCLPMLGICGVYACATHGFLLAALAFLLYVSSAGTGLLAAFAKAIGKVRAEFGLRTNHMRDCTRLALLGCLIVLVMSDRLWLASYGLAAASIASGLFCGVRAGTTEQ